MADLARIARISLSDLAPAIEALRAAWRSGDLDGAALWLDALPEAERGAWCTATRERLGDGLGAWLEPLDGSQRGAWLHRLVPWQEARFGDGVQPAAPLVDLVQRVRADLGLWLVEPATMRLAWSPRAAQLWACDCVERAIGHAELVLPPRPTDEPTHARWRRSVDVARAIVVTTRTGGDTTEDRERAMGLLGHGGGIDAFDSLVNAAISIAEGDADFAALGAEAVAIGARSARFLRDGTLDGIGFVEREWQAERLELPVWYRSSGRFHTSGSHAAERAAVPPLLARIGERRQSAGAPGRAGPRWTADNLLR